MSNDVSEIHKVELSRLRELSARIGCNPLLTQASTGNTSIKLGRTLWIKSSGKWLADALREDILIPLDLHEVRECIAQKVDPAEIYACASIETAMHAVLRHSVVLHVHSVNTIAWAVRQDAPHELARKLNGLRWRWVPYVPSGLPLAQEIKRVSDAADSNILVLGNHGLVIGGEDCDEVADLLAKLEQRLAIPPRSAGPTNFSALEKIARGSSWELPRDEMVHALATDRVSQAILSGGVLFPCQSIFSDSNEPDLFSPVPDLDPRDKGESPYGSRPFLIISGQGVMVRKTLNPSQRAIMSGLAQVVQRINPSAPIHYLTDEEVAYSARTIFSRYQQREVSERELHGEKLLAGVDGFHQAI